MIEVISGLHKGKVGKISQETHRSYTLDVGDTKIIVLKNRCREYKPHEKAVSFTKPQRKVLSLFN